jgi:hypothetical protein
MDHKTIQEEKPKKAMKLAATASAGKGKQEHAAGFNIDSNVNLSQGTWSSKC